MPASYPKRADHFKKWSQMMLEQALVPERLEYKGSKVSASTKQSSNGGTRKSRKRRKRFLRRKRQKQD